MKKLLVEFIGTFFFILTIAMVASPFAIASMLMAWLYIGAPISGGHFNPMVTLAVALRDRLPWHKVPYYMLAQIAGGFLAFAAAYYFRGLIVFPAPAAGVSLFKAFIVEILLSFVFALVVLFVATSERYRGNNIFGFAIAFTIPALAAIGASTSGGLFNPAISIGSALFHLVSRTHAVIWENLAMYVIGAFIGGALAACAFKYLFCYGEKEGDGSCQRCFIRIDL